MKVFKFGGASVKDAEAVRNVGEILKRFEGENICVVISAMGKTTNALEAVVNAYYHKTGGARAKLGEVKKYHRQILTDLFKDQSAEVFSQVNNFFVEIEWIIEEEPARSYSFIYDQVVSIGELVSTRIVSAYLNSTGIRNNWMDIRNCIQTDNSYREGKIKWELTTRLIKESIPVLFNEKNHLVITQGFIGSTSENYTTTLGREGSDYTAAIIAHSLDAECVMIWKDVPGVLNADPKFYSDAQVLESISSHDAIELTYYGATVIHPKTIKPLENKKIPLYVKSFVKPDSKGTMINSDLQTKPHVPSFIFKSNQVLISISAKDFSFIAEDNLSNIFRIFSETGAKINLMQNSAISFSVCVDNDTYKIPALIEALRKEFKVLYNDEVELCTIRNYFPSTIEQLTHDREVLVEQRSRHTAQFVMKSVLK